MLHFDLCQNLGATIRDLDCKSMITIINIILIMFWLSVFVFTWIKDLKSPLN